MKSGKKLIQSLFILTLPLLALTGNCSTVTTAADTSRIDLAGLAKMLPNINRDLKICDLVKKENALLNIKTGALESSLKLTQRKQTDQAAQLRKEKRRRVAGHVARTVIEVSVIILIIVI